MKRTGATDSLDTMVSPKTPKIRQNPGIWASGPPLGPGPYDSPYSPFVGCTVMASAVMASAVMASDFTRAAPRTP